MLTHELVVNLKQYCAVDPAVARDFGASFLLEVEGVGAWTVLKSGEVLDRTTRADCVVTIKSDQVFSSLVRGSLNPQVAFKAGDLRLKGPLEYSLRFVFLLEALRLANQDFSPTAL